MRFLSKVLTLVICIFFLTATGCSNEGKIVFVREGEKYFFYEFTLNENYESIDYILIHLKDKEDMPLYAVTYPKENSASERIQPVLVKGTAGYFSKGNVVSIKISKVLPKKGPNLHVENEYVRIEKEEIIKIFIQGRSSYSYEESFFEQDFN